MCVKRCLKKSKALIEGTLKGTLKTRNFIMVT